jgi:hypothetical protein
MHLASYSQSRLRLTASVLAVLGVDTAVLAVLGVDTRCTREHTTATHHVAVDGTSQRGPCCSLDGPQFWRPNDAAHNTRRARIFRSTELHPIFADTLPLHTVQTAMPPCPGRHLDTDAAMEDPRSPVLLMGLGNGQSYGAFEQAPMMSPADLNKLLLELLK